MPSEVEVLNQWLKDTYGNVVWGDHAKYRVSWTTGQVEKRLIQNRNVFSGQIFLRTESGVFEVPRYPFDKDRWVVEKCVPNPSGYDIVDSNYSYEPLFILQTNKGVFLPLEKKAVRIIINFHENPQKTHMTPGEMESDEARREAEEVAEFEAKLEDAMTPWTQIKDLVE